METQEQISDRHAEERRAIKTSEVNDQIIFERILGLEKWLNEKFITNEDSHEKLIIQTTKTNGRVTILEKFQNILIGAFIVINASIVPVLLFLVYERLKKGV